MSDLRRGLKKTGNKAVDENFELLRRDLDRGAAAVAADLIGNRADQVARGDHRHAGGAVDCDPLAIMAWDND